MSVGAGDLDRAVGRSRDLCAEGSNASQAAGAVGARGKICEPRFSMGQATKQSVAVGDALIARQAQAASNVARGLDDSFGSDFGQSRLREKVLSILKHLQHDEGFVVEALAFVLKLRDFGENGVGDFGG